MINASPALLWPDGQNLPSVSQAVKLGKIIVTLFGDWINGLEILNCVFVAKEALYLKVNRA